MAVLAEFIELREQILKNAIYNRILTSVLSEETKFCVASALLTLRPETKETLEKEPDRKKLPSYVLYDIFIRIRKDALGIGLKYSDHPIIWEFPSISAKNFKSIVEFIFNKYSINPAKSDTIFSSLSSDVRCFFENNDYPVKQWRMGFSKKVKKSNPTKLKFEKIEEYQKALRQRNAEYRAFNRILINILKLDEYRIENDVGTIVVQKSNFKNKFVVNLRRKSDWKNYIDIFPIHAFDPRSWDAVESDITKGAIVSIIH